MSQSRAMLSRLETGSLSRVVYDDADEDDNQHPRGSNRELDGHGLSGSSEIRASIATATRQAVELAERSRTLKAKIETRLTAHRSGGESYGQVERDRDAKLLTTAEARLNTTREELRRNEAALKSLVVIDSRGSMSEAGARMSYSAKHARPHAAKAITAFNRLIRALHELGGLENEFLRAERSYGRSRMALLEADVQPDADAPTQFNASSVELLREFRERLGISGDSEGMASRLLRLRDFGLDTSDLPGRAATKARP